MKAIIEENKQWIDETFEKIDVKLQRTTVKNRNKFPCISVKGQYDSNPKVTWWTNGFWGGINWLMYEATGNEEYKITAERAEAMLDDAFKQFPILHHDVGFMWHLVSGAKYRLTGDETSAVRNLFAAAMLASRYNVDGDFIQAWNYEGKCGYSIIDSLMNLALLYWASEKLGNDRFKRIAIRQMDMALRDHIRPDGSINHIVDHEIDKVGVKAVVAGQGYSTTSCWTRGLAWAIYGSVISYRYAGKEEYLDAAKRTADYFIENCKKNDYLTVIDFGAPAEPVYYDSSAGMCAASGMLEIAKYVSAEEGRRYTQEAIRILKASDEHFCNYDEDEDALVLMASAQYPTEDEHFEKVHIPYIFGDFFFVEAMLKLKGREFFIW